MRWLAVVVVVAACSSRAPEPAGVGKWRFTATTLADAKRESRCQPTELADGRKAMWCFGALPVKIGKRVGAIDLYFNGVADDARLIEIQIQVRGCDEEELDHWMRVNFGVPAETRGTRSYWKNAFLWAAALMPAEPARCIVHFVPLGEGSEIERLKLK